MASPMSFVRRYQRSLMVVFGVTLMVVFLVGMMVPDFGALTQSRRESNANEVVVQWKDGSMTRKELDGARIRYFLTMDFLERLRQYASQKTNEEVISAAIPLMGVPNPSTADPSEVDDAIVSKKLLANLAYQEGIVVSDAMVNDYLMLTTKDAPLTEAELSQVAMEATDRRLDIRQIREYLKEELAAQQMQILYRTGMVFNVSRTFEGQSRFMPNPTEARQLFERSSAMIEAEVLPVNVDDYLEKVSNSPTNAEIKEIFEEGKYDFEDPTGESPGFKIPRKMKLQYFVFDRNAFLEAEMNKLTDKEIQEEYDRLVKDEDPLVMELIKEEPSTPPADGGAVPATGEATTPPGNDPPPTAPKQDAAGAAENADGTTEKAADEKTSEKTEAEKSEAEKSEAENKKEDGGQGDASGGGLSLNAQSPEFFVSTTPGNQEQETAKQEEAKQEEQGSQAGEQQKEAERQQEAEKTSEAGNEAATETQEATKQAEEAAGAEQKTDEQKTEAAPPTTDGVMATDPNANVAGQSPDTDKPKMQAKPLKDVVDDVKRRLKSAAAAEALQNTLELAEFEVRDYQSKFIDWESMQRKPDEKFDFYDGAEFAKNKNIVFKQTDLVSQNEFTTDELATARIFNGQQLQEAGPSIFATYSKLNEYDPNSFQDFLAGKSYLFWVVEKQDQQVPQLADAKENVIKFWKRQKAFEAAKIDAEKIAEKANAEKKSLLDTYGEKAVRTGEFSWFSSVGQFGISEVIGVDGAGETFMKTAFSLNEGQAGAAPNMDRNVIYVIRITQKRKNSPEDFNRAFIDKIAQAQDFPLEVQTVTGSYLNRLTVDWQNDFRKDFQIQWIGR